MCFYTNIVHQAPSKTSSAWVSDPAGTRPKVSKRTPSPSDNCRSFSSLVNQYPADDAIALHANIICPGQETSGRQFGKVDPLQGAARRPLSSRGVLQSNSPQLSKPEKTIRENPMQPIATSPIDGEEGDDIFILRVTKHALGDSYSPSLERPWFDLYEQDRNT